MAGSEAVTVLSQTRMCVLRAVCASFPLPDFVVVVFACQVISAPVHIYWNVGCNDSKLAKNLEKLFGGISAFHSESGFVHLPFTCDGDNQ